MLINVCHDSTFDRVRNSCPSDIFYLLVIFIIHLLFLLFFIINALFIFILLFFKLQGRNWRVVKGGGLRPLRRGSGGPKKIFYNNTIK